MDFVRFTYSIGNRVILSFPDISENAKSYCSILIALWNVSVERNNLPEYDYTPGTKIFILGTIILLVACIVALLFEPSGMFALFLGGTVFLGIVGTYAAATDMTFSSSAQKARFVYSKPVDASVAQMAGIIGGFFAFFPLLFILLAPELGESNLMLAALLGGAGGLFLIIGGIVAGREWDE